MEIGSLLRAIAVLSVVACNLAPERGNVEFRGGLSSLSPAASNLTNPVQIQNLDDYDCTRVAGKWGKLVREDNCGGIARQKLTLEQYNNLAYFRIKRRSYCLTVQQDVGGERLLKTDHCGAGNPSDELFRFVNEASTWAGLEAEVHSLVGLDLCLEGGSHDELMRVKPCDGSAGQRFRVEQFGALSGDETVGYLTEGGDTSGGGETTDGPPPPPPPPGKPGPCPDGEDCCLGEPHECIICMPPEIGCP